MGKCDCGNNALDDYHLCEWCAEIQYLKDEQTRPHGFGASRFTGAMTCQECGLLAIDDADYYSDCEGEE